MTVRKTMLFTESQVKNYVIGILYEVERDIDSMFRVCVNNDYNKEYVGTAELYLMLQKRRRELKK